MHFGIISVYSLLTKNEHILEDKLESFFFSEEFRKAHLMSDLPDDDFITLFLTASKKVDKKNIENLMNFMTYKFSNVNFTEFKINS